MYHTGPGLLADTHPDELVRTQTVLPASKQLEMKPAYILTAYAILQFSGTFALGGDGNLIECPVQTIPPRPALSEPPENGEIHISADESAEVSEDGQASLKGNIDLAREGHQLRADRGLVDKTANTANVEGNIHYWNKSIYLHSDAARLDLDNDKGAFNRTDYQIARNQGHGRADAVAVIADKKSIGTNIDYTTCANDASKAAGSGTPWRISAQTLELDHETERGVARNAVLRVGDIPVLYTPYLTFPLSDRRATGFLMPTVGSSNRNGLEIQTPWYWNISPAMDATFTPRLLSNSGVMLMGEYRYMFATGVGALTAEFLPSDRDYDDRDRSFVSLEHSQSLTENGRLYLLLNNVSDKRYFEDFGQTQVNSSSQFLERRAEFSWGGENWGMFARLQDYQTVDESLPATSRTYRKLPQIVFNAYSPLRNRHLNYGVTGEFVYFDRGDNPLLSSINGYRVDVAPSVSWPLEKSWGFLRPGAGLRFTAYGLDDAAPNQAELRRTLPYLDIDSGLFFERPLEFNGRGFVQTLEPRFYYLYIPEEDQSDLPVFDTGIDYFAYDSMFHNNRFIGGDRIGDANQITLAVASRLLNEQGIETLRLHVGQIYYLRDREVVLPGQPIQSDRISPLIAGFQASLRSDLYVRGELEWDPNLDRTQRMVIQANYNPEPDKILNFGYRARRSAPGVLRSNLLDIEQTTAAAHWPLGKGFSAIGSWKYALAADRSLDILAGLEYNGCCWSFRAVGRRFLTNVDGEYQNGVYMQFELKGLASAGRKTMDFLTENITGLQREL
ncbi:MAG: LPS-assembly protein LptD [Gammaproteobacteria bacterium]|nr:MAG: LPS-assembly protein LptD [Gammaproteobacteria bacterium]